MGENQSGLAWPNDKMRLLQPGFVMIWKPNVTVAAILERDGQFLLVEEETPDGILFNQPAGHLDEGESIITAAIRETLEETAHHFQPSALVGIYRLPVPQKDLTYLRFAFTGAITGFDENRVLDDGILRAVWLSPETIQQHAQEGRHRSPLVWQCVSDYLAGKRYPIDLLTDYPG